MKVEPRYIIAILLIGVLVFVGFNESTTFKNNRQICISMSQNFTVNIQDPQLNQMCVKNRSGSEYETTTYVAIFVILAIGYIFMAGTGKKMLTMREAIAKAKEWMIEQGKDSVVDNTTIMPQMKRVDIQGKPEYYSIGFQETAGIRAVFVIDVDCWTGDIKSFKRVKTWDAESSPDIMIMAVPKEVQQVEVIGGNAKEVVDKRGEQK